MNPRLSAIVAVYNVQEYITKCADSLVNQSVQHMEIIFVNDGSTDNSLSILREYEKKYSFVRVVDKENGGLSSARNAGLKEAQGEYICFIDGDDFIKLDMFEKLLSRAEETKADMVICKYIIYEEDTKHEEPIAFNFERKGCVDNITALRYYLEERGISGFAWNKLYKKSLFTSYDISYPMGRLYEDIYVTAALLYHASSIAFLDEGLYYYVQRGGSITKTPSLKGITDFLKGMEEIKELLFREKKYEVLEEAYRIAYVSRVSAAFVMYYLYILKCGRDEKSKETRKYLKTLRKKVFWKDIYKTLGSRRNEFIRAALLKTHLLYLAVRFKNKA